MSARPPAEGSGRGYRGPIMDLAEQNRTVRAMVQHEDGLRAQRLGWLLTINGFMFATLGFAWDQDDAGGLIVIVAAAGVALGVSGIATNMVSNAAIAKLERWYETQATAKARDALPPVKGIGDKDFTGSSRALPALYLWELVPMVLVVAWVGVLVAHALR